MIIIAGHSRARTAGERDAAVAAFAGMVERARAQDGCLDLSIGADPADIRSGSSLRMLAGPAVADRLAQDREGAEGCPPGDPGEPLPHREGREAALAAGHEEAALAPGGEGGAEARAAQAVDLAVVEAGGTAGGSGWRGGCRARPGPCRRRSGSRPGRCRRRRRAAGGRRPRRDRAGGRGPGRAGAPPPGSRAARRARPAVLK